MNTVADEYASLGPLEVRILTHQRYSEGVNDVDADVLRALALDPAAALLDVGSGTGEFLRRLRTDGGAAHTGRLCALDSSPAAVAAASAAADGVDARLGDAMALPFDDAEFDAVTARHMLYHVPDPVQAIREARRVLRAGGRFAAVVNIARPTPLISETVDEVVRDYDSAVPFGSKAAARVHAENLPGMVDEVFGSSRVTTAEGALVFREPEPVIRYCLSILTGSGIPLDGPVREEAAARVTAAVRERFAELGGVWRDRKGYVVCVAER